MKLIRNTSTIVWELARTDKYSNLYESFQQESLRKFQLKLTSILIDFDKFCKKFNLEYAIVAGTLIGAYRHKGFIPWDDDIDVVMPRKDYEKLKEIDFSKEFGEYIFEDSRETGEISLCGKFMLKNISYYDILGGNFSKKKKPYIDVLPVDYVPENKIKRFFLGNLVNLFEKSFSSLRVFKKNDILLNEMSKTNKELKINIFIRKIVSIPAYILGPKRTIKIIHKILMSEKNITKYSTIALGVKGYFSQIIKSDSFFPSKEILFEGSIVKEPFNGEVYLKNRYGNYMEIPSLKEQEERLVRLKDNWKEIYYENNKCSNGNL